MTAAEAEAEDDDDDEGPLMALLLTTFSAAGCKAGAVATPAGEASLWCELARFSCFKMNRRVSWV